MVDWDEFERTGEWRAKPSKDVANKKMKEAAQLRRKASANRLVESLESVISFISGPRPSSAELSRRQKRAADEIEAVYRNYSTISPSMLQKRAYKKKDAKRSEGT